MEKGFVTLGEALNIIQLRDNEGKPFPFDFTYRTFNGQSKKGGKLKEYKGALHVPSASPDRKHQDNIFNILDPVKSKRPPNHFTNRTRNIEVAPDEIRTIRIDFIISINNQNVIY